MFQGMLNKIGLQSFLRNEFMVKTTLDIKRVYQFLDN